ncbi:ArsR family transcriptional regulator [Candidatus Nitrosopumilus koreensis AR1]|uniref:ArsR family transcriptional regulator n=2 Tax=Nitrosopumilaceae TaxID=338190 RepID=K0B243_9ARCH|nr:ArsR family transcriptional regulator [Candidatus Nitrosopumilus koreensis AR1]
MFFILSLYLRKIPFSGRQEKFTFIMANDPDAKRLLWFIFAGSRGGLNRLKIISKLKENPLNTNQLANELGLDYKAIQHHIKVLEKNNLITKTGEKYGIMFFISTFLEVNMETFEEIEGKLDKSK